MVINIFKDTNILCLERIRPVWTATVYLVLVFWSDVQTGVTLRSANG